MFKTFGDMVTSAPRPGGHQSVQNILSVMFKLLGNSTYGKRLTIIARLATFNMLVTKKTLKRRLVKKKTTISD